MIVPELLISCRLQVSKSDSHSKRENRQPLQHGLPTKFFADRLQVLIIHLGLLSTCHLPIQTSGSFRCFGPLGLSHLHL